MRGGRSSLCPVDTRPRQHDWGEHYSRLVVVPKGNLRSLPKSCLSSIHLVCMLWSILCCNTDRQIATKLFTTKFGTVQVLVNNDQYS